MALPNTEEMRIKGYDYCPCPLKTPPPVPANIFLHHLLHEKENAEDEQKNSVRKKDFHKRPIWGRRMPQKVNNSIFQMTDADDLVIGWGVHITEGLNKRNTLLATLFMLLTSGIVSVTWTVTRSDVQGGFGIGAWLTSVQAVVLMLILK